MEEIKQVRKISLNGKLVEYILIRKKVKNINLTIKLNSNIIVSANKSVSIKRIDAFLSLKADYILFHIEKFDKMRKDALNLPLFNHDISVIKEVVESIYPIFLKMGVSYPLIKLREMKSRWGTCMVLKKQIVLNKRLLNVPIPLIEYVVLHEFAHFIHPNHSKQFYLFVEKLMPDYKIRKKQLQAYAVV